MGWLQDILEDGEICHVCHDNDGWEHCTGVDDLQCWCGPQIERTPEGAIIVIHHTQSELDDIVAGALRPH